jgi:predicted P-loop ATPase
MSEAAKARNWLGELEALVATDELAAFQVHALVAVKARPDLMGEICRIARASLDNADAWIAWLKTAAMPKAPVEQKVIDWSAERARGRRAFAALEAKPAEPQQAEPPEAKAKAKALVVAPSFDQRAISFQHSKSPRGIASSLENANAALAMLELDCRYDIYHDKIVVRGTALDARGDVLDNLDNVTLKVRQAVLNRFGFDPGANFTYDALISRCLDYVFDPVRDYLDALRWDGKPRLDGWLRTYCGIADTALNRAIGRKVLVAGVRRVRQPGCKFDYIMVLEGTQGAGKSTMLKLLAGEENFTDSEILGYEKREQQEAVQGIWIYEIAELDGLHKSDVTKVKLFASKTVDSARPAFGRSRVDRPRRGIFVATTNDETYLRDTTGNRRFWPVGWIEKIDLVAISFGPKRLWPKLPESSW